MPLALRLTAGCASVEHEMEASAARLLLRVDGHEELGSEEPVPPVARLAGEVELRGQHAPAARLNLDVEVPCPAGVEAGDDGREPATAFVIGELMAAQAETFVVVLARVIGMPEIEQRAGNRP